MRTILTYGTFDLLHVGHVNLLSRAFALGDRLVVGLSTDEFNKNMKDKTTVVPYVDRRLILMQMRCVDQVIPETCWTQKPSDIQKYNITEFVMGHDWQGRFDYLSRYCKVTYLPRTEKVSTTLIKRHVRNGSQEQVAACHQNINNKEMLGSGC